MKLKNVPKSLSAIVKLKIKSKKELLDPKVDIVPVIVTLTTIPFRLGKVHITIRSVLAQSKRPEKIILWLHESMQNKIPRSLRSLEGDFFEIKFTHLHCSHKKLIFTKKLYPEKILITCDDDFVYSHKWCEKLYSQHLKFPKAIIANRVRTIIYDHNQELRPYKEWKYQPDQHKNSNFILPIGANGILYPKDALDDLYHNEELFLRLAPKADDLWFKAMSLLKGIESRLTEDFPKDPIPIIATQRVSLKNTNVRGGGNVEQWKALEDHFGLKKLLFSK